MKTIDLNSIIGAVPEKAGNLSETIGKGLMAGFIGTGIMTLAQLIEMKFTKRESSDIPVKAVEEVAGVEIAEEGNSKLNNAIHFLYGTGWGKVRAILASLGLKWWQSSLLHFGLVWSVAAIMLPKMKLVPPVKEWGAKSITIDILHHLIYAASVGFVYDKLSEGAKC